MRNYVPALIACLWLTGCGLKGPLYLPEQKPSATPPPVGAAGMSADEKKPPTAPVAK
jgi:predicted small lipoprotein YifL